MRILITRNIVYSYLLGAKSPHGILSHYLLSKIRREPHLQGFLTEAAFQDILKIIECSKSSEAERHRLADLIAETLHLLPNDQQKEISVDLNEVESEEIALALRNSLDALITSDPSRYKLTADLLVLTVSEFLDQYRRSKLNRSYLAQSLEVGCYSSEEEPVLTSYSTLKFLVFQSLIQYFIQELEAFSESAIGWSRSNQKVLFGNEHDFTGDRLDQLYEKDDLLSNADGTSTPIYQSNDEADSTAHRKTSTSDQKSPHPYVIFWGAKFDQGRTVLKENLASVLMLVLVAIGLRYINEVELAASFQQSTAQEEGSQDGHSLRLSGLATLPVDEAAAIKFNNLLKRATSDLIELAFPDWNLEAGNSSEQLMAIGRMSSSAEEFSEAIVRFNSLKNLPEVEEIALNDSSRIAIARNGYLNWNTEGSAPETQNPALETASINTDSQQNRSEKANGSGETPRSQNRSDRFEQDDVLDLLPAAEIQQVAGGTRSGSAPIGEDSDLGSTFYDDVPEDASYFRNLPRSRYGTFRNFDNAASRPRSIVQLQVGPFEGPLSLASSTELTAIATGNGFLDYRSPYNTYILGGRSDDTILTGSGKDILNGDRGSDSLTGGRGADTFIIGYGATTITDFNVAEGDRIEILGNSDSYSFTESDSNTIISVKDQTIARLLDVPVGQPIATVKGVSQHKLRFAAGEIKDLLIGSAAGDTLVANTGSSLLFGEAGNDVLIGAKGRSRAEFNLLTGGKGADVFVLGDADGIFHSGGGFSRITDFNSQQRDRIVLAGDPALYSFERVGSHTEIRMGQFSLYSGQLIGVVENKQNLNYADVTFLTGSDLNPGTGRREVTPQSIV